MRLKLAGTAELIQAMEQAAAENGIAIPNAPVRRESAELRLGVKDWLDVISIVKDVGDVTVMIMAAVAWIKAHAQGGQEAAQRIEITTPAGPFDVLLSPETTREDIEAQLKPLRPRGNR